MHLLFISKNKIELFKGHQKINESSWTKDDLGQVLSRFKSSFSSRFRVLLSDDFITTISLTLTKKESKKRNLIQVKAQNLVSENLSQTIWDYKVIANQGSQKLVQITLVSKDFFDYFRQAVSVSKIKIDLVESFSTSICRYFPKNKLIFLVYQDLLILLFNRTPIFSQVLSKKISQSDIDKFLSLSEEKFKILPQEILFSPTGETAFNQFDFKGILPKYIDLDPIKGIINSPNTYGPDESTTRLKVEVQQTNLSSSKPFSSFPKILLIIPILSILTILFVIFSDQILSPKNNDLQMNPIISITPTATLTPTINPSQFKIKVLNGSGIKGQANQVVEILSPGGFIVSRTGNAANYDFSATEIKVKSTVPLEIIKKIQELLKSDFATQISSSQLESTDEYDIIITTSK